MIPRVMHAECLGEHKIRLPFADGAEGDVHPGTEPYGETYKPLKGRNLYKRFTVHPEFGTFVLANGADIAPEFLYVESWLAA